MNKQYVVCFIILVEKIFVSMFKVLAEHCFRAIIRTIMYRDVCPC